MRRSRRPVPAALCVLPLLLGSACAGVQSVTGAAGPAAGRIESLWWLMLVLTGVAWLLITGVLAFALLRRRHAHHDPHSHERARRRARTIGAAVAASVILLATILGYSMLVERASAAELRGDALEIDVIGYQWWWDVIYRDPVPANFVRTANELYLPAGRTIELRVRAADVIHSLWIPNLQGKIDLLPDRTNVLRLRADRPGVFRGQCAEFCGVQHAHMAFDVVVLPEAEFERWRERMRAPAAAPADSLSERGRTIFLSSSCVLCHEVRGTIARAVVAPDLTHLASRRTIAAGTLPNIRGNLAAWILDPQHIKPGTMMPATNLDGQDLHALLHYLESLR